jgi:hypothetical protein
MADLHAQTPQPPTVHPRLRFHKVELAGMALIALLPLAAILGLFGPASAQINARIGDLRIEAEYPERLRTAMAERISIELVNDGSRSLSDVTVSLDREFMRGFDEVAFTPEPQRPYEIELATIDPGGRERIEIEVHGAEYGLHEGRIRVEGGGIGGSLPVRTLIFP